MSQRGRYPVKFYTSLQRRLHWLVFLLVVSQYALHEPMKAALLAIEQHETLSFLQFLVTTVHAWGGMGIAAIMIWRWQIRSRDVPVAAGKLSHRRARWVRFYHSCLYVVLLLMSVTGALHYYAGFKAAGLWHHWGKWLLLVMIAIHIAGALTHLGNESRILQRMLGRDSLR